MTYYRFDPVQCHFFVSDTKSPLCDPKRLRFAQLSGACWTDMEKATEAVAGVMQAKVRVLEEELLHTRRVMGELDDTFACDHCDEILSSAMGNLVCLEDSDEELWLCDACYQAARDDDYGQI